VFAPTSRYAGVPTTTLAVTGPDGAPREITYVRRRALPRPQDHVVLAQHTVEPGERLDHLADRYLGDATQFWRICDAAGVLRPADLEEPGRRVPIAMPPGG
jgi:hypothetical protein